MADNNAFGVEKKVGNEIKAKPYSKKMASVNNLENLRKDKTADKLK